jgi:hypothetical protein
MTTVIASDLDGTVVFSTRALGPVPPDPATLHVVDSEHDRAYAYMTTTGLARWAALARSGAVVPATTRSARQYQRLNLPGPPPWLAVVCNGGRLLVDGEPDAAWDRAVRGRMAREAAALDEVWKQVTAWHGTRRGTAAIYAVEDLFVYLTVRRPADWRTDLVGEIRSWVAGRGWWVSLQGRKLYLLPAGLDKAAAVVEAAARLGGTRVVAGGDSLLDEQMLRAADAAIRPAHGELHEMGFAVAHCRTTAGSGAAAGDEILDWYTGQVGA